MNIRHLFVVAAVVQSSLALSAGDALGTSQHQLQAYVVEYIAGICPSVPLNEEVYKFGACVISTQGMFSGPPSMQQICAKLDDYLECIGALIASLKTCGHVHVTDSVKVIDLWMKNMRVGCKNSQIIEDLMSGDCVIPNAVKCSPPLVSAFQKYLNTTGKPSTFFSRENCRHLETALECSVSKSATCAQKDTINFFQKIGNNLLDGSCRGVATSAAVSSLLIVMSALLAFVTK